MNRGKVKETMTTILEADDLNLNEKLAALADTTTRGGQSTVGQHERHKLLVTSQNLTDRSSAQNQETKSYYEF